MLSPTHLIHFFMFHHLLSISFWCYKSTSGHPLTSVHLLSFKVSFFYVFSVVSHEVCNLLGVAGADLTQRKSHQTIIFSCPSLIGIAFAHSLKNPLRCCELTTWKLVALCCCKNLSIGLKVNIAGMPLSEWAASEVKKLEKFCKHS